MDEVLLGSGITILMEESNYCLDQVRVKEGTGYDPTAALLDLAEDAAVISQNLYALDPVFFRSVGQLRHNRSVPFGEPGDQGRIF